MDKLALRVAARFADLSPPLGYPGGPCHVVERIHEHVRNPKLRDELEDDVARGEKLTNPDAAKIYHVEQETGAGFMKRLIIGPHAQYRMDLRGVTVPQVRATLKTLNKLLGDLKSQRSPAYDRMMNDMQRGTMEYVDPRLGLAVVLALEGRDVVKLVTTYWKGESDPRPPGEAGICHVR